MAEKTKMEKADGRAENGRPHGTLTTESSNLVARVRAASGLSQEKFAAEIGVTERTTRRYEKFSIIPKSGEKREAIEKAAKRYGVSLAE